MPRGGSWQSSPLLIILLPIITLTLLFLTVPPLLSATSHILRPTSVVKNSWDSLNILLVVFAILVGVFAPRNDDESPQQSHQETTTTNDAVPQNNVTYHTTSSGEQEAGSYVSQQWFGFSEERKVYDAPPIRFQPPATGVTRLRRSSSSYPDLRHWDTGDDRYKFRFFDDFEIHKFRSTPPRDQAPAAVNLRKRWPEPEEFKEDRVKEIPVDTFEISSTSSTPQPPPPKSPATPPPPPPPPPTPPPSRKPRRTQQKVDSANEITEHDDDNEFTRIRTPPPAPLPPSPSVKTRSEHKRRKSNVKREIAMVWASVLSNQRKRKKKQRTKSDHNHDHHYDNVDELTNNTTPAPPPPPPPPPPPSVFQSLFRKGSSKSKKIHSVSTPPPPPPPPPLTSSRRWSKERNSQIPPPPPEPHRRRNSGRPPLPNKVSNYNDENINNAGNQSPQIPVPPPPPPFKMPAMKFVVRGDFVKIRSNHSSLCSSPEREDIDVSSTVEESEATTVTAAAAGTTTVMDSGEVGGPVFCPSPDVNIKAATFIAKLRGKWKLEKINSMKEKGNGNGPLLHE